LTLIVTSLFEGLVLAPTLRGAAGLDSEMRQETEPLEQEAMSMNLTLKRKCRSQPSQYCSLQGLNASPAKIGAEDSALEERKRRQQDNVLPPPETSAILQPTQPAQVERQKSFSHVVVVTGGTRGVGLALLKRLSNEIEYQNALIVFGGTTAPADGEKIIERELSTVSTLFSYLQLNLSSEESIQGFVEGVKGICKTHGAPLSHVLNVAGAYWAQQGRARGECTQAQQSLMWINFLGPVLLSEKLAKIMKPPRSPSALTPQIVFVGSTSGKGRALSLNAEGEKLRERVRQPTASVHGLRKVARDYLVLVQKKVLDDSLDSIYSVSKLLLNAASGAMSRELLSAHSCVLVNALCPGPCRTDMNPVGSITPAQGAERVVEVLRKGQFEGIRGKWFERGKEFPNWG